MKNYVVKPERAKTFGGPRGGGKSVTCDSEYGPKAGFLMMVMNLRLSYEQEIY
jgi:hypothetical protein